MMTLLNRSTLKVALVLALATPLVVSAQVTPLDQFSINVAAALPDNSIDWNGVVYDGTVKSEFDIAAYDISYIWWARNEPRHALGPMLRLTYFTIDSKIDLTIDANGDPVLDDSFKRSGNTDIPAPTIGAAWRWMPADHWRVNAEAGYMSATIEDFVGSALVASGGVTWFRWENWGFSLSGIYIDFDVDTSNSNFAGNLNTSQWNYNLGVTYRF